MIQKNRGAGASAQIDRFFQHEVEDFKRQLSTIEAELTSNQLPVVGDSCHRRVLAAFQQSQEACSSLEFALGDDSEALADAQRRFRDETAPWFSQSWIADRSRTKPSGFPGDYEMLVKLYDEQTPARGIGGYLDLCILDLPLARAVRSRLAAVRDFLIAEMRTCSHPLRVLDIASGPCREYEQWPETDHGAEIVAFDSDPQALAYVASHVVPGLPANVSLRGERYNALRTRSAETTIGKFGRFDLLYSVGLCDYLPDEQLIEMLRAWQATLNAGGVMYVAFKDAERYDKTPYQWHLDWFFFQRNLEDCLRLYEVAGFERSALEMSRDTTGIIMNFVSRTGREVPPPHFDRRAARERRRAGVEQSGHPATDG